MPVIIKDLLWLLSTATKFIARAVSWPFRAFYRQIKPGWHKFSFAYINSNVIAPLMTAYIATQIAFFTLLPAATDSKILGGYILIGSLSYLLMRSLCYLTVVSSLKRSGLDEKQVKEALGSGNLTALEVVCRRTA